MIARKTGMAAVFGLIAALGTAGGARAAETFLIDLTHPIPTFHPVEGDPTAPDLNKPWGDSRPIPTFGQQTVLEMTQFPKRLGNPSEFAQTAAYIAECGYINGEVIRLDSGIRMAPK